MSKNVLIISVSPRKSESLSTLVRNLKNRESGRKSPIALSVEPIKIEHCVKQNNMEQAITKMREVDRMVLAIPVYF